MPFYPSASTSTRARITGRPVYDSNFSSVIIHGYPKFHQTSLFLLFICGAGHHIVFDRCRAAATTKEMEVKEEDKNM